MGFGAMHGALWLGFIFVLNDEFSLGDLTAFQSFIFQIGFGLGAVGGHSVVVMQARGASARCFEILDRSPAIPLQGGTIPDGKIEGDISFKDVNFSYPSRPGESIYVPAQSCRLVWVRVTLTRFNTFTYL